MSIRYRHPAIGQDSTPGGVAAPFDPRFLFDEFLISF